MLQVDSDFGSSYDDIGSVAIGRQVTEIESSAFSLRLGLTEVNFGTEGSLLSIGIGAFQQCQNLTINIGNVTSLVTIAQNAFQRVQTGGTLEIPRSVTGIGISAFQLCNNLVSLNLANATELLTIGQGAFALCQGLQGTLEIPGSVTGIGNHRS